MACLNRPQGLHQRLRQQRLEGAPAHGGALAGGSVAALAAQQGVKAQQVVGFRPLRVAEFQAHHRIGLGPFHLLGDQLGRIEQVDARALVRVALAHLAAAVGQAHHPRPLLEDQWLGHLQHRDHLAVGVAGAEAGIHPLLGDVARQLKVLLLVFAHGHQISVVEEDVGRHQHRVIQQAHRDLIPLFDGLLLELDHPLQPVQRRDAVQQPAQLAVGRYVALHEHRGACRINAAGQIERGGAAGVGRQPLRIMGNRDRMQVHHAEKRVVAVLQGHPVADGPEPVAQMQGARGLNAGENPGA